MSNNSNNKPSQEDWLTWWDSPMGDYYRKMLEAYQTRMQEASKDAWNRMQLTEGAWNAENMQRNGIFQSEVSGKIQILDDLLNLEYEAVLEANQGDEDE